MTLSSLYNANLIVNMRLVMSTLGFSALLWSYE